jgi:hypothetical protein
MALAVALAPLAARAADPPRWRLRGTVSSGVGGASDRGDAVAMFPTSLEIGVRIWGPLSADIGSTGVVAGTFDIECGEARRPNAILGYAGLRADFANGRSSSWVDPFLAWHAGVGTQAGGQDANGACTSRRVFATGGLRGGIDVWLGKAAVTVAVGFDYLPTAAPIFVSLGLSRVLY